MQLLFLLLAYLLGSVPFGFIIGKMKGIDIRTRGSKNIGATNVARVLGKPYFLLVFILDLFKGFIFVFLFRYQYIPSKWCMLSPILYGVAASFGHVFPVYLRFNGGKAVATGAGMVLGYDWHVFLIGIVVFLVTCLISKIMSLSSLLGALAMLVGSTVYGAVKKELLTCLFSKPVSSPWPINLWFIIGVLIVVLLIFIKHKDNIKRLKNNTEKQITEFK